MDVDNVIYLNKDKNDIIKVQAGCLEYQNKEYSIIKNVSDNLDGGADAVKRRFKVYEN